MMAFAFYSVPQVVFGVGEFRRAGEIAAGLGRVAFIIYNGSAVQAEKLVELLKAADVASSLYRQRGEPVVSGIDQAVEEARRAGCDVLIGLGGGSAIDAAKAVAALLANGGLASDYMEVVGKGQKINKAAMPWIAIPTTAGTGAEATRNAVIGLPDKNFKASIRNELLLPRVALVDPQLGVEVPPEVTARSGMDALCQLIESYTSTGASAMTDALALQGIPLAGVALPRAFHDGGDLAARQDMALAALFSGMTLTNAGLGAVHGFAAPIGANFPAPHGAVCAALLAPIMRANVTALLEHADKPASQPTLRRYAQIGRLLAHRPELDDTSAYQYGIWKIEAMVEELAIPKLSRFGLKTEDIPAMVELAKRASSMRYNPVKLSDEALAGALSSAI